MTGNPLGSITDPLTILSWNISGQNVSFKDTRSLQDKYSEIIGIIMSLDPDILCLQEIDSSFLSMLTQLGSHELISKVKSHCLQTAILIKPHLVENATKVDLNANLKDTIVDLTGSDQIGEEQSQELSIIPAASMDLIIEDITIRFHSVHLPPFKDGAYNRLLSIHQIMSSSSIPDVIIGDTNMRDSETTSIRKLNDLWILYGSQNHNRFTWNSKVNKYHSDGYPFTCRFDRMLSTLKCHVVEFDLVGTEMNDCGCYLSDHFGIFTQVQFQY